MSTPAPAVPSASAISQSTWNIAAPLLQKWLERARTNQLQHFAASNYYARANNVLGIPVIVFTSVVGTTVFASLQKQVGLKTQLIVGAISVAAAVLAALQTFLRYSERAEKHRSVAASYGSLRKQIEAVGYLPAENRGGLKEFLDSMRAQFDALAQSAPDPPETVWNALRLTTHKEYFIPEWMHSEVDSQKVVAQSNLIQNLPASRPESEPYRD